MANRASIDGKVAIITGAGNGLGARMRSCSAARGSGGKRSGRSHTAGQELRSGNKVVERSKPSAARRSANYELVEDGAKISRARSITSARQTSW